MLNKLISETLEYIDIENSTKREEGLLMNIGSYLSLYRDLWMTPIRVSFEVVFQGEDVMGETGPYR